MKARRLTQMAMLTAIALTIFMIEAQIPPIVPIPGIKLGLSNIITVFANKQNMINISNIMAILLKH